VMMIGQCRFAVERLRRSTAARHHLGRSSVAAVGSGMRA
jgi:hypothetical protein